MCSDRDICGCGNLSNVTTAADWKQEGAIVPNSIIDSMYEAWSLWFNSKYDYFVRYTQCVLDLCLKMWPMGEASHTKTRTNCNLQASALDTNHLKAVKDQIWVEFHSFAEWYIWLLFSFHYEGESRINPLVSLRVALYTSDPSLILQPLQTCTWKASI